MPGRHTRSSRHLSAPPADAAGFVARSRAHAVRRCAVVIGAVWLVALTGCGAIGPGGGGSGSGDAPAEALEAVYLTPGATEANLAWTPSEGPVESYLVFVSRNGSPFAYATTSPTPSATVTGQAGDTLQITVAAVSDLGEISEASPPSAPLVFQAAEAAAVVRIAPAVAAGRSAQPAEALQTEALAANAEERPDAAIDPASDQNAGERRAEATKPVERRLVFDLRALLLGGDARLPEAGLSEQAHRWLQARVDEEIAAGVSLAGLGRADGDDLREVVWQDQSGQIFVSDGQRFLEAGDLPGTFREAVRLRATERFVGLSDFDGDGLGDWLLEDAVTGDVWLVDALGEEHRALAPATPEDRLAGLGDFDGDGRAELLWWTAGARLALSRPDVNAAPALLDGLTPDGFELLAIADLDGNGRDDLLGRDADGRLLLGMSEDAGDPADPAVSLGWRSGAATDPRRLDLLGTLDVDDDGRAEIAWLDGDALEIWSAEDGLRDRLAL